MRRRSKPSTGRYVHVSEGTIIADENFYQISEDMFDQKVKPGPLRVQKTEATSFIQTTLDDLGQSHYTNWSVMAPLYVAPRPDRLSWKKLPTSNQFDVLTTLAEFDDTIAMFSTKLLSSFSYGGYKWGWTPLLNDICAVNDAANAVKDSVLAGNRRTSKYSATDSYTLKSPQFWDGSYYVSQTAEFNVKYSGFITIENDVLSFYDYMGFHPSPKLFWDLVPMSFAIDYVLPIGDMLSNITPSKGWVKAANFTGWRVMTVKYQTSYDPNPPKGVGRVFGPGSSILKSSDTYVVRDYLYGAVLSESKISKSIGLKLPSLEQAFDIGYLANTLASGPKKKKRPKKEDGDLWEWLKS